jgi:hypothetical protein
MGRSCPLLAASEGQFAVENFAVLALPRFAKLVET